MVDNVFVCNYYCHPFKGKGDHLLEVMEAFKPENSVKIGIICKTSPLIRQMKTTRSRIIKLYTNINAISANTNKYFYINISKFELVFAIERKLERLKINTNCIVISKNSLDLRCFLV